MTREEKLRLITTENIKTVAMERIGDIETVIGWFDGNEDFETATHFTAPLNEAIGFIYALSELYGELNDTGTVNCDEDDEPEEEYDDYDELDYESEEFNKFKAVKSSD